MITGTFTTVNELREVIDHTAPVVAHNGMQQLSRIKRAATVGSRLSPTTAHELAGPAQQMSTT